MKNLIILILLSITTIVNAQYNGTLKDTITTSGSTYSDFRYPLRSGTSVMGAASASASRNFLIENSLSIIGTTHRISGTVAAKLYLQYANGSSPSGWKTVDSLTLTGTADQAIYFYDSSFEANRFRLWANAASSTQSVYWYADWAVKPE